MKNVIVLISFLLFAYSAIAQNDIKTSAFKVEGNCSMCKKRIEDAAYIKGVKRADWNEDTHMITVVYRSSKTDAHHIERSIAKAGHTTENVEATDEDYKKLPECCQYKTNNCEH